MRQGNQQKQVVRKIYSALDKRFGPQYWWPGETPFEVAVGAILTQNTAWTNVEQAIKNLKVAGAMSFVGMNKISQGRLARLIKPAGYFNVKAKRLKSFVNFLGGRYSGCMEAMAREDHAALRLELLSVNGIGPETADSILLYACLKPAFVVDAYTRRIFSRHGVVPAGIDYEGLARVFAESLPKDRQLFNEYHALIVRLGKEYCRNQNPRCAECPIRGMGSR